MGLSKRQAAFADAYIENGGDAAAAARAAGYSESFIKSKLQATLSNPVVRGYISARREAMAERCIPTLDEILELRGRIMRDESEKVSDRLRAADAIEAALSASGGDANGDGRFELPARVISRGFVDINREIVPNVPYVFRGGRGSGKSSFISEKIIELLVNNPKMHACAVRRVGATLRDSVFAQLCWAIRELGLSERFETKLSPLEIIYKPTGQTIFFRGCDDPVKLKSIKPPFGYIGILWKEELDQFRGEDEVRSIDQSILRGGDEVYDFSSYNPPRSASSWVNRASLVPDGRRVLHSSTYLDIPPSWLGDRFIEDAERLRTVDPRAYEHEYLGVPNGDGGRVFDRIECRRITDEEAAGADVILQGIDFGWYPDSFAFVRAYYDRARERIFLLDELYVNKWSNARVGEWIAAHGYGDYRITCDSAEPKSISDLRDLGLPAVAAVKGPGSVEYGFKWLANRTFVVDPERTPNACRELSEFEYARDRAGNVVSDYVGDDHAIAALRYAFESVWRGRG